MAKIKLLVKTDKNINELKRKEIQSIDWSSFPYSEQIQYLDAETYSKLTIEGRRHIDHSLPDDYNSKPVEFWNVVAAYKEASVAHRLWHKANLETKGIMLENHPEWFEPYRYSYLIETGEVDGTTLTALIMTHGDSFQYNLSGYWFLADPKISVDEFNTPFTWQSENYPTLLHFIYEVLEDAYEHDEYPVLLHNDMLKSAGYPFICDLSPEFLRTSDACREGSLSAKKWIKTVTGGKKDYITWDEAVNYIRSNPETYEDDDMMSNLTWWWSHSILGGY